MSRATSEDTIPVVSANVTTVEKPRGQLESDIPEDPPDGGFRAWLVVFGTMFNTFSTLGYSNSWGAFQRYYQETILKDSSPSSIAWIGSIQFASLFLPALVVGRLFDIGYFRSVYIASSILLVVATFLVAECTVYWQFLLCQGLATGIACGGLFGPTAAIIAHWFKKRRGLAMSYVAMGSSIGGTVLPIMIKHLLGLVGFPWTMRIIGFIFILTVGISNLTLKRRLPPKNVSGGLFNLQAFKFAPYTIYCISGFVNFLGLYTVLAYIDVSALSAGVSQDFSFYFVAIANASSFFGRYCSGLIADKIGSLNVMIPFTAVAGVLTYIWPFVHAEASLVVVTIIYGFSCGSYVALLTNPLVEMGGLGDVGRRTGMFRTLIGVGGLVGTPISGAINSATGGFHAVGYYAGTAVMVAVALMCVARQLAVKRLLGKF
ncbi:MFS general substrate transporter [Cyathus striatus]|nr:MFS general substrate transporter [Cyathus striatus]